MEEVFELVVKKKTIGELTTNAKEVLVQIENKLAEYKPENYSPENVDEAKKDKAMLNSLAKTINDERIKIEREFMAPFGEFKETANLIVSKVKDASGKIDSIVKDVEQKEKDEKKSLLVQYFETLEFNLIAFDRIFDPKWLNKTVKLTKAREEIDSIVAQIKGDMEIINRLGEDDAKVFYLDTLNLNDAIKYADDLKAKREAILETEKAEQEAAPVKTETEESEVMTDAQPELDMSEPEEKKADVNEILTYTLKFHGTMTQLTGLKDYMNRVGITYEKV